MNKHNTQQQLWFIAAMLVILGTICTWTLPYLWQLPMHPAMVILLKKVRALLHLDYEMTLMAWFSSLLLALAGLNILKGSSFKQSKINIFAGGILLLLSIDEATALHEKTGPIIKSLFPGQLQVISHTWLLAGTLAILACAPIFIAFLKQIPTLIRRQFLLGFAIFFGGAVGLEFLDAILRTGHRIALQSSDLGIVHFKPINAVLYTIEESLEITGIIVLFMASDKWAKWTSNDEVV